MKFYTKLLTESLLSEQVFETTETKSINGEWEGGGSEVA